jgi:hypothetical protein
MVVWRWVTVVDLENILRRLSSGWNSIPEGAVTGHQKSLVAT